MVARDAVRAGDMVRVATFDGPGASAQIRAAPYPDVPSKATLIRVEAGGLWHRSPYSERSLAKAAAMAMECVKATIVPTTTGDES